MPDRSLPGTRFLGFDVFGTVVDWRTSIARAGEPFLRTYAIDVDPADFADQWRALYQPAMQAVRSGERAWVPLEVLNRENLDAVLRRHGTDPGAVDQAALAELNDAWARLDPWPDSVAGLQRLRQRFSIGALSNGSMDGMQRLAAYAGLPWDLIAGAEVTRTYKPDPRTYLGAADAAGVRPEQAALVAAHNDDLAAACALGLRTVFVRRPHEHGPGQTADLQPTGDWDVVADSLTELADALECP